VTAAKTWEYFPGREKIKKGHLGELIKLPLGKHGKTGRRGLFLQENGTPFANQAAFLRSIEKNDSSRLESIAKGESISLETVSGVPETAVSKADMEPQAAATEQTTPHDVGKLTVTDQPLQRLEKRLRHLHPLVKEAPPLARQVVNHCKLVEYFVFKALEASYLTHRERFMLLCVLGHLGNEGCKFLHKVISYCLNYNYQITEKYIRKMPAKPVSCPRLRQEYQELTAELGCDCKFPQRKGLLPVTDPSCSCRRTAGRRDYSPQSAGTGKAGDKQVRWGKRTAPGDKCRHPKVDQPAQTSAWHLEKHCFLQSATAGLLRRNGC
jgi:hypothetical protein